MRTPFALVPIVALALALAVATRADDPSPPPDAPQAPTGSRETPTSGPPAPASLVERSLVELVLIETYVTDRRDRPIRGLTAEDFVLKIDSYVRPIASIEHRVASRIGDAAPGSPGHPDAASGEGPPAQPAPAGSRFARRFVLFLDDETSSPEGLGVARQSTARFLEAGLQPSDEIAIVAFRHRLRLLQDFTTDRAALRRVLDESFKDPRRHSTFVTESASRTRELQEAIATSSFSYTGLFRRATDEDNRIMGEVLSALQSLVESLAPWPGYKGIVYLGDGIPENPGRLYLDRLELPASVATALVDATLAFTLSEEFRDLVEAASGAGVTLHSVQTSGLTAGRAGTVAGSSRRSNALETLALNTGGIATSSNDLGRALADVENGSREYYVIGYAPEAPPDGLYHSIQLQVKRSGLRVRWRRGFTRFLPAEMQRRTLQAAHLLPGLYGAMRMELIAVPGPPESSGRTVDLVLHIPPGRLLMLPESGDRVARLDVGMVALAGSVETLRLAQRVTIRVKPSVTPADRLGTNLFARVRLPAGSQSITAVVSDLATGEVGAARAELPGQTSRSQTVGGLSIYSLVERSVWIEIRDSPAITEVAGVQDPYSLGPALGTTFTRGEQLACGFRTITSPSAPLRLRVLAGGTTIRAIDVKTAGPAVRTVPIPSADLTAGDYVLVLEETGPGGPVEVGRLPFAIRPADPAASAAGPA